MREEQLYERVLERIDLTRDISDEELTDLIREVLQEAAEEEYIPLRRQILLSRQLFHSFRKLDILQELIEDDTITEIMINGTDEIFLERDGRIVRSDRRFLSQNRLEDVIQQIVAGTNRYVNESSPIVDARLEDGSRVNVVLKPVALNGPIVTIRKFPKEAVTMEQLILWGSLPKEAADFLKILVRAKYNIFVSGGTGAGKTTFLNVLSDFIPKEERIITIEDNAELQIHGVPNLVRLEARNANLEGEVRGEETVDMISSAMLNGHSGSMSTGHANNPADMLHRLETMMMMGIELPLTAIQRQIASALDIIVHLGRLRDKSRRVLEIAEVMGVEDGQIRLRTLYEFREEGMENGKIKGTLVKVEELAFWDKLLAAGYQPEGVCGGSSAVCVTGGDCGMAFL